MTDMLQNLGNRLLVADTGLRWPDERLQLQYTGTSGERLLGQTIDFIKLLNANVPELRTTHWKGIDYGVGWGRMASLMTHYGHPNQLDCVDAWSSSLDLARGCGLQNKLSLISPLIKPGELATSEYDFIYAYSIFTHLPASHLVNNIRFLSNALKPGGVILFTVREPKFLEFLKRSNKCKPQIDDLDSSGYWFGNVQNADYGDSIFSLDTLSVHLSSFGALERLGPMALESTQICMKLTADS